MASSHSLVFLHGWGTYASVWKNQVAYFSKKYNVETPNFNLLSTINYQLSTILIGWSYGGMLAIELAAKQPHLLKALVLVGCSAKFTDGLNPIVIKNIRRNLDMDFEETMRNCYGTFFITDEARFLSDFIEKQILPEKKETRQILDRLLVMDLRDLLKDIKVPTLIVHGDKDQVCPLTGGMYLHENIKNSRMEIIRNAGHLPFYTRAEEFNRVLEGFLEGID